ncbi:hypothetical protein HDU96_001794, partial [Phlyctochytrium bullatum]
PTYHPNLTVVTDLLAHSVVSEPFPDATGKIRAGGVRVILLDPRGRPKISPSTGHPETTVILARREVVVSAGAVQSPKLLKLSGVGPVEELRKHGIALTKELKGVGLNLQDHLAVLIGRTDRSGVSYTDGLWNSLTGMLNFLVFKKGMMTCGGVEAMAFRNVKDKEREKIPQPDMQLHMISVHVEGDTEPKDEFLYKTIQLGPLDPTRPTAHNPTEALSHYTACANFRTVSGPMFKIAPTLLHPRSHGTVTLASSSPLDAPILDPRYLEAEEEVEVLAGGMAAALELLDQIEREHPGTLGEDCFDKGLALELARLEGKDWKDVLRSDAYLREFVRRRAITLYHPVGTCKMGPASDPLAVVDPTSLKVHGFANLRVADASVMPAITSRNTNAPSIMIGEVCADMIKGKW